MFFQSCSVSNKVKESEVIHGEAAGDNLRRSVSLSSDDSVLVIGAPRNDGNGDVAGHDRVSELSGSEQKQKGSDIDSESRGDYSGTWTLSEATEDVVGVGTFAGVGSSTITFNDDGSYSETHTGNPSKPNANALGTSGTYTVNKAGTEITFDTGDQESKVVYTVSSGTLVLAWTVDKTSKSYFFSYTK